MAHVPRPRSPAPSFQKAALRMDDNGAMLQRVRAKEPTRRYMYNPTYYAFSFRHSLPTQILSPLRTIPVAPPSSDTRVTMALASFCAQAAHQARWGSVQLRRGRAVGCESDATPRLMHGPVNG